MPEQNLWGIHAGRTGDAHNLFMKSSVVALGWAQVGDLNALPANREAFKSTVASVYPNKKAGAIPGTAGQLFRFMHEMKVGDIVIYPSKNDKQIHIGEVKGGYVFNPGGEDSYPHRHSVIWQKHLPRTTFSQGALYEIGSALSFFRVKDYAEEYLAALKGSTPATPAPADDTTVGVVAEEIEETTRDFVLKTLGRELKGHQFSDFVGHLLRLIGYKTRISSPGPDGGIDILAHRDELGLEPPIIKVQVKSTEGSVGDPVVSALYGKVGNAEFGLLVSLGDFTKQARSFAESKSNLRLLDGDDVVNLVLDHYEQFDSAYKRLLPLKRVYVPQPIVEDDE